MFYLFIRRPPSSSLFPSSTLFGSIVAALMAFLAKAGALERRRHVAQGAWAAIAASVVTAVVVELLFEITPGQRETLEGGTIDRKSTRLLQSLAYIVCRILL